MDGASWLCVCLFTVIWIIPSPTEASNISLASFGKREYVLYNLRSDRMTWDSAVEFCEMQGGQLAVIEDFQTNKGLVEAMTNVQLSSLEVWIGGFSNPELLQWAWVIDNLPVQGFPVDSDLVGGEYNCAYLEVTNEADGEEEGTGFFPKYDVLANLPCDTFMRPICATMCDSKTCGTIIKERQTWIQARRQCSKNYNDLFVFSNELFEMPDDLKEGAFDKELGKQVKDALYEAQTFWIGLRYRGWQWIKTGETIIFTGAPLDRSKQSIRQCLIFRGNGTWLSAPCDDQKNYICQFAIPDPPPVVSNTGLIVGVVVAAVLIILCIAGAVYFVWKRRSQEQETGPVRFKDLESKEPTLTGQEEPEDHYDELNHAGQYATLDDASRDRTSGPHYTIPTKRQSDVYETYEPEDNKKAEDSVLDHKDPAQYANMPTDPTYEN